MSALSQLIPELYVRGFILKPSVICSIELRVLIRVQSRYYSLKEEVKLCAFLIVFNGFLCVKNIHPVLWLMCTATLAHEMLNNIPGTLRMRLNHNVISNKEKYED